MARVVKKMCKDDDIVLIARIGWIRDDTKQRSMAEKGGSLYLVVCPPSLKLKRMIKGVTKAIFITAN